MFSQTSKPLFTNSGLFGNKVQKTAETEKKE